MLSFLLNLSPKQLTILLVLLSCSVYIHLWYVYYVLDFATDIKDLLLQANRFNKNLVLSSQPKDTKYILHWTDHNLVFENGESVFNYLHCEVQNCIFTKNKDLLGNYNNFDALMFDGDFLALDRPSRHIRKPENRSKEQVYIFKSTESSFNQPACELHNDDFYNWTFTYRLDSTIVWHYFVVRNASGHIVAPSKDVHWSTDIKPHASTYVKKILLGKHKAAIWLVSNCKAQSLRDEYLSDLQEHLYHYSMRIDLYGDCTPNKCDGQKCYDIIKQHYFFYMAFENSICEDYVTEKVLHGYNNYAIPIVYGGANYTRFLPDGSYINAREMHPHILAKKIKHIIDNPDVHESYFKWRNEYIISANGFNSLCDLCEALNEKPLENKPAIKKFRLWWNGGPDGMKWCLSEEFWNETQKVSFDRPYFNSFNSVRPKSLVTILADLV